MQLSVSPILRVSNNYLRADALILRYTEWKDYFLENLERLIPKIYKPAHKAYSYGSTPPVSHPRSPPRTALVKLVKPNYVKYAPFWNEICPNSLPDNTVTDRKNWNR